MLALPAKTAKAEENYSALRRSTAIQKGASTRQAIYGTPQITRTRSGGASQEEAVLLSKLVATPAAKASSPWPRCRGTAHLT